MPKAAVYKDSYLLFRESKIRLARQIQMPSPPRDTLFSQYFCKPQLCGYITCTADRGHIF